VATIRSQLRDRVTLQVRSVDCLFLQVYVPRLMSEGQLIRFLLDRGFPIPLPALLGKIGAGYKRALERFAQEHDVPVVRFGRRESKEEISRFGVVLIGVAQERARVWARWRAGSDGHPHFAFGRQSRLPNYYYLYRPQPRVGPRLHQVLLLLPLACVAGSERA
jgi:hypothetical protein